MVKKWQNPLTFETWTEQIAAFVKFQNYNTIFTIYNCWGIFFNMHMDPPNLSLLSKKVRCLIHHPRISKEWIILISFFFFFVKIQTVNQKATRPPWRARNNQLCMSKVPRSWFLISVSMKTMPGWRQSIWLTSAFSVIQWAFSGRFSQVMCIDSGWSPCVGQSSSQLFSYSCLAMQE